jgi:tetratricopeptide (TPR) repeat protein
MSRSWWRFALLLFSTAACILAQRGRGGGGSSPVSPGPAELVVRGTVTLAGGMPAERLIRVDRNCGGRTVNSVYADSKGKFSFDLGVLDTDLRSAGAAISNAGPITVASQNTLKTCVIRASLLGYHPQAISLEQAAKKPNLGDLVLEPIGKPAAPLLSVTDSDVPKNAKKDFDKGLDEAAKAKWQDAISAFEKAASGYKKFATAWVSLGMLQTARGDAAGARKSFAQAIAADDQFAAPYIELAAIEAGAGDWGKTIEYSNKAIALDPDSFALAYYLNAMANVRLVNADAADKSATAGLHVDQDHEYPDIAYIQGLLLASKGDQKGARKQFEDYLAIAPNGVNAAVAKQQLAELPPGK